MRREPRYARAATVPGRTLTRLGWWPFPDPAGRISPEIRRAALLVLRTTARDWGLDARR